ncbi:MAG TPA: aldo/keto reductase, partial [Acidimicrobiales bacterium]|nr:aldo/keto reductase [Acidimicrobiales bacterium]
MTASLGVGCAPLGNLYEPVTDEDAAATIDAAWEAGIRFFDTAPLYGNGLSERRLGESLRSRPRHEYRVSTKVGRLLVPGAEGPGIFVDTPRLRPRFDFSYDGVMASVEASLGRLGLDRVDVLLVHDPDDFAEEALAGAFPALRRLRDEGVTSAIGAGMNQSEMLARFVREAEVDCVLVAGRWTLIDRSAGEDLLPLCHERSVEVIAGGVFNSGLLAGPDDSAHYDYRPAPGHLVESARRMAAACRRRGLSLPAAALAFAGAHPAVSTVLVGVRSPEEVWADVEAFGAT